MRIIGGRWRGRRIAVPRARGLRPTPDRVRETLFNWLAPMIAGARCLDLFAGTGVLGLEAASRGAAEVVLVERERRLGAALRERVAELGAVGVEVVCADALRWLDAEPPRPFDIVFVDPPYVSGLQAPALARLARGWLAPGGRVYVEYPRAASAPVPPAGWREVRAGTAGAVVYRLLEAVEVPSPPGGVP